MRGCVMQWEGRGFYLSLQRGPRERRHEKSSLPACLSVSAHNSGRDRSLKFNFKINLASLLSGSKAKQKSSVIFLTKYSIKVKAENYSSYFWITAYRGKGLLYYARPEYK